MELNEYQVQAKQYAKYKSGVIYTALGLGGESGEVLEKVKKEIRDRDSKFGDEFKEMIIPELGDVLWYIANFAKELDVTLEEVAQANLDKLSSRSQRGKIHGDGDNR